MTRQDTTNAIFANMKLYGPSRDSGRQGWITDTVDMLVKLNVDAGLAAFMAETAAQLDKNTELVELALRLLVGEATVERTHKLWQAAALLIDAGEAEAANIVRAAARKCDGLMGARDGGIK